MKKCIEVIAGSEAYENLSTFTDIEELNKTVRRYRDIIKLAVTRKDVQARLIDLLEILKRHSCKQIGVSYMCKNSISSYLNVSYKTIQRLMKKLEALGMIKQIATKRKSDMRQTANAIVIVPFIVEEEVSDKTPSEMTEKCPTNKTTSISLKQNIKKIRNIDNNPQNVDKSVNNYVDSDIEFYDYSYVSSNVPTLFIDSVRPFFNKAKDIYKLWSRLNLAARKTKVNFVVADHIDVFVKTFKETIYSYKQNKVRKDLFGFIYGAWRNKMVELSRRFNDCDFYNWMEA